MAIPQRTGCAASLGFLAAIGSFATTCSGHPFGGLVLAIAAIPLGVIGAVISISPWVKGGLMSVIAAVLGVLGVLVAVLGILGHLGGVMLR